MDVFELHDQFRRICKYLRNEKEMNVNQFMSQIIFDDAESKLAIYVTDDCEWSDNFREDLTSDNIETTIDTAWSWAMSIPSKPERLMQLLIRRMNGLASVADSGALHDEANRQMWQTFARMMRDKSEEISKNGLPKPDDGLYADIAEKKRW